MLGASSQMAPFQSFPPPLLELFIHIHPSTREREVQQQSSKVLPLLQPPTPNTHFPIPRSHSQQTCFSCWHAAPVCMDVGGWGGGGGLGGPSTYLCSEVQEAEGAQAHHQYVVVQGQAKVESFERWSRKVWDVSVWASSSCFDRDVVAFTVDKGLQKGMAFNFFSVDFTHVVHPAKIKQNIIINVVVTKKALFHSVLSHFALAIC